LKLIKVAETSDAAFYGMEDQPTEDTGMKHFHIRAHGVYACVTGIDDETDAEAEGNALGEFLPKLQIREEYEDWSLAEIFGNERLTYCAMRDCDGSCGMAVHVVRMEDGRRAVPPHVLILDLI
jgi:hypothetical protein